MFGRRVLFRALACVLLVVGIGTGGMGLQACDPPTPPGGCKADADCAKEEKNKKCDKNTEKCVECITSGDCGANGICDATTKSCRTGCSKDEDCKTGEVCQSQACVVKCDTKADCKADERCNAGICKENTCEEDKNCSKGEKCDGGKCVPAKKLSGKYGDCESTDDCEENLVCLQFKGATSNQCWKKCGKGCNDDEVCVKADRFAEGHDVCMTKIDKDGVRYSYLQGTACAEGLISLSPPNAPGAGSCMKDCKEKCLEGKECLPHPNVEDKKVKFCFLPCKSKSDCPDGVECKEHADANNAFYCLP